MFNRHVQYFVYSVLPFGLSSAGCIFTKCLRCLVKHWRSKSFQIVVYLDDGFGLESSYELCSKNAAKVKQDLIDAGFILNNQKSVWKPVQKLKWLGFVWDMNNDCLEIPQNKLSDVLSCIQHFQKGSYFTSARMLAQLTGRIISMSMVLGNIAELMTKHLYHAIVNRTSWDSLFNVSCDSNKLTELNFWKEKCLSSPK